MILKTAFTNCCHGSPMGFFFFAHLRGAACGFGAIVGNGRGGCGQKIELVDLWPFVCCGEETGEGGMGNYNRQGGEAGKLASGTFLLSLWPTNGARETEVPGSIHLRPGSWFQTLYSWSPALGGSLSPLASLLMGRRSFLETEVNLGSCLV